MLLLQLMTNFFYRVVYVFSFNRNILANSRMWESFRFRCKSTYLIRTYWNFFKKEDHYLWIPSEVSQFKLSNYEWLCNIIRNLLILAFSFQFIGKEVQVLSEKEKFMVKKKSFTINILAENLQVFYLIQKYFRHFSKSSWRIWFYTKDFIPCYGNHRQKKQKLKIRKRLKQ